jgi:hypothetical protein
MVNTRKVPRTSPHQANQRKINTLKRWRRAVSFIEGDSRDQISLLPACIDDYVAPNSLVRVVDAFVASLDMAELGFNRAVAAATGRPGFQPGDILRLCIWG